MYIWFVGNKEPKYIGTIPRIQECLLDLINLLENRNLLPGFHVERPEPAVSELEKTPAKM